MAAPPRSGAGPALARVLGRRAVELVLVLWGAATITFAAVKAVPGDPVQIITGGENVVDAEQRAVLTRQYGLDQPLPVQYLAYLRRALTGDLGDSYVFREPVHEVLLGVLGPTAQLALTAFVLAVVLALASALLTAGRRGPARSTASGLELLALSTPVYWVGIVLLVVFSFGLGWFPVLGAGGPRALVLPAVALSLPLAAVLAQVLRQGLEDALRQPFALTVRSRGVGEGQLRRRHALRHALLAASTVSGTLLGGVLTGSVLTETVFGRPGVGQVLLQAISARDMPLVLGVVLLAALVHSLVSAAVDVGHTLLDPRLRDGARP